MRNLILGTSVSLVASASLVCMASAQSDQQVASPEPYAKLSVGARAQAKSRLAGLDAPEVQLNMNIQYVEREIFNPLSKAEKLEDKVDKVRLRAYVDANAPLPGPDAPLVGPTIETRPGQILRISLHNKLPFDESCVSHTGSINDPHCFNGTNLHTHGLWVNPAGNGDNVLIRILPGVDFDYEYAIPSDHPAGTFWYHPHLHGSTALQVGSGMSGAIIIRGDRLPTAELTGDIDTLLMEDSEAIKERVMVLQQIQYACGYEASGEAIWDCDEDDVGEIEEVEGLFGPGSWSESGRYTSVNGHVLGTFEDATVGKVERWRMIHAGVRDTINMQIRRKISGANPRDVSDMDHPTWIDSHCEKESLDYGLVAQDGLTMNHLQVRDQAVLQPGYRVDALVMFPEAGDYCIIDADGPDTSSVNQEAPGRRLLGVVTAKGGEAVADSYTEAMTAWLVKAAEQTMPASVIDAVTADLEDGLKLSKFIPHQDIEAEEVTGTQSLAFSLTKHGDDVKFLVDNSPYDPNRVDRTVALGSVDEWTMTSNFVSHPFHIHVNPFQVVAILDPFGKDVSAPGAIDDYNWEDPSKPNTEGDPQFPGMKGVWKDTLWIKNPSNSWDLGYKHGYRIITRTRYQRYIGEYVLHCHILDHEDQGMMQNFKVVLPDGAGGMSYGHGSHSK